MCMKIMITGACGFLGHNLVRGLSGHDLILIDKPPELFGDQQNASWVGSHELIHVDITENMPLVMGKLEDVDLVIHLANRARIPPSWLEYESYYRTNITGSQSLFHACQLYGVKKFIYISSSSVYGNNGTQIQKETDPLKPTNPYAVSKMAAEAALTVQSTDGPTELIIVRPFTMYGDFMNFGEHSLVVGKFLSAWEKDEPLLLHGGGLHSRDFIHSSDAVDGLKLIIEHGRNGDIFNLGFGESVTIKELADIVSSKQIVVPDRKGAVDVTHADITKLKTLGFSPKVRILEWLTSCVDDYKLKEVNK